MWRWVTLQRIRTVSYTHLDVYKRQVQHTSTVSELTAEQDQRIQELEQQLTRLQSTLTTANQTTFIYRTLEENNSQLKFFGRESENPLLFLNNCQREMDTIGDTLSELSLIHI